MHFNVCKFVAEPVVGFFIKSFFLKKCKKVMCILAHSGRFKQYETQLDIML